MRTLTLMFALFLTVACKKSNTDPANPDNVGGNLRAGTWRVTRFDDHGTDRTNSFAGYVFTFNGDGTVRASNSVSPKTGNWGAQWDDGVSKLILSFSSLTTPDDFARLTNDWKVNVSNSTHLEVEDERAISSISSSKLVLDRN